MSRMNLAASTLVPRPSAMLTSAPLARAVYSSGASMYIAFSHGCLVRSASSTKK
jgi:hypothetical protein